MNPTLFRRQLFKAVLLNERDAVTRLLSENSVHQSLRLPRWRRRLNIFLAGRGRFFRHLWWHSHLTPQVLNWTSLAHAAVEKATPDILSDLLLAGAWHDIRGTKGETPLHLAAAQGKLEHLLVLVEHGGNLNIKNHQGETAKDILMQCHPALFYAMEKEWVKTPVGLFSKTEALFDSETANQTAKFELNQG